MPLARPRSISASSAGCARLKNSANWLPRAHRQTLKSKHLDGEAVDLMAYIGGGRASWELNLYDDIAGAMRKGAELANVPVRWGAAWHITDIRDWKGTMEEAMNEYIDLRRKQGRRPFIDAPHFEIGS
jgi:peptidoglycan LD-endopeptidase CwlK